MKKMIIAVVLFFIGITNIEAQRGCCSHHGGVAGCSSSGRQVCNDGTLSPSCTCTPSYIYGCTDPKANNYNSKANKDNGSCKYKGCRDSKAINYDSKANISDGSCLYAEEQSELQTIPFTIQEQKVENSLDDKSIIQPGKDGQKSVTYRVVYDESGTQVSKTIIKETITQNSTPQIIGVLNRPSQSNDEDSFIGILIVVLFLVGIFCIKKGPNHNVVKGKKEKQKIS